MYVCIQEQCDTLECGYDGGDCVPESPWRECPSGVECKRAYADGHCDLMCNTRQCLFDGRDCAPVIEPCPEVCRGLGTCNELCNTGQCRLHGHDCSEKDDEFVSAGIQCHSDPGSVSLCTVYATGSW